MSLKRNKGIFLFFFISFLLAHLSCIGSDSEDEEKDHVRYSGNGSLETITFYSQRSNSPSQKLTNSPGRNEVQGIPRSLKRTKKYTSLSPLLLSQQQGSTHSRKKNKEEIELLSSSSTENSGEDQKNDGEESKISQHSLDNRDYSQFPSSSEEPSESYSYNEVVDGFHNAILVRENIISVGDEVNHMRFNFFDYTFQEAVVVWNEKGECADFQLYADTEFLRPICNWKIVTGSVVGGIFGLPVSSGMTAMFLGRAGNLLHVPVGGWLSTFLVVSTMVVTTPAHVRQFYGRTRNIMIYFTGEERFTKQLTEPIQEPVFPIESPRSADESSMGVESKRFQLLCQKSYSHYAMDGVAFATACVDAFVDLSILLFLEKKFSIFAGIVGPSFFFSSLDWSFYMKRRNVQYLFNKYLYDDPEAQEKRVFLLAMLDKFDIAAAENDEFVEYIYKNIQKEFERIKNNEETPGKFFALSCLLLQNARNFESKLEKMADVRMNAEKEEFLSDKLTSFPIKKREQRAFKRGIEETIEENAELRRRIRKISKINEDLSETKRELKNKEFQTQYTMPSLSENLMNHINVLMTGAAWTSNWAGTEYMLNLFLTSYFGMDPTIAYTLANCGAGLQLIFKIALEYKTSRENFQVYIKALSETRIGDWVWPRRIIHTTGFVFGGAFALTKTAASLLGFQSWSLPTFIKGIALTCQGLTDLPYYYQLFNSYNQDLLTASITTISKKYTTECDYQKCCDDFNQWVCTNSQRTWLRLWSQQLRENIEGDWNDMAIELLNNSTQKPKTF